MIFLYLTTFYYKMPYKDPHSPAAIASYKKRQAKYRLTQKAHYRNKKAQWKKWGVKWKDEKEFKSIYEEYTTQTHCEFCYTEFKPGGMDRKCLDHDHETGEFRFILCCRCNIWRISD